jgi:maltose O-acetyltransferase
VADRAALVAALEMERAPLQPVVRVTSWLIGLLPDFAFTRARSRLLALVGWKLGPGASVFGVPRWYGSGPIRSRLTVGEDVLINVGCTIELNDTVTIGDSAALGHEVMILTTSHRLGTRAYRAGDTFNAPVTIEEGAWVGARSVLLPGVTVGAGAVVMAGSVVNKDVAPNTLVAGVPADVVVKRLPG